MIESKKILLVALILPIVALMLLTAYKAHIFVTGRKFTFAIQGYDPRDLLSGHYIRHTVDYGTKVCPAKKRPYKAYVCLEPKKYFSQSYPHGCQWFIVGMCRNKRFEAGIERYYIPKKAEQYLTETLFHSERKTAIVVSVHGDGSAQIVDLLIDGDPFRMGE